MIVSVLGIVLDQRLGLYLLPMSRLDLARGGLIKKK